jgi:hypothetical protein
MPVWAQWVLVVTGLAVGVSRLAAWWRDRR